MASKKATMKEAYEAFVQEKKVNNLSEKTLDTYSLHIKAFLDYLEVWNLPSNISKDEYNWFIEHMQEEGKKDVTITSYCRSIRAFIYWLQDNEYTDRYDLALPKYQKTIKKTYTEEEVKLLLKDPRPCTEVEYQTWVFINLVMATGLRLSSVLNIKVIDYNKREATININTTKNNNALSVSLNPQVNTIINKYIGYFDLSLDDYIFCTANKNRLAVRTIEDNVATYNRARGVDKTSIHLMRHTFAKNYYLATRDIYALCRLLDHSDISTTQGYIKDLGVPLDASTAYNPQALLTEDKDTPKRRRGKIK